LRTVFAVHPEAAREKARTLDVSGGQITMLEHDPEKVALALRL
jgi:hypothetical protein